MDIKTCDERHENLKLRLDSQSGDIKEIFRTKISWRVFYWTLGILSAMLAVSFRYTNTLSNKVAEVVTKQDMLQYQEIIIEAIKAAK